jgi:hypothetical protein
LEELEFLAGVGRVGDQLADEDLFVGVKGMDNEIEQLRDFGLESVFFDRGHKMRAATLHAPKGGNQP